MNVVGSRGWGSSEDDDYFFGVYSPVFVSHCVWTSFAYQRYGRLFIEAVSYAELYCGSVSAENRFSTLNSFI